MLAKKAVSNRPSWAPKVIRSWQPEMIDQEHPVSRSTLDWMQAI